MGTPDHAISTMEWGSRAALAGLILCSVLLAAPILDSAGVAQAVQLFESPLSPLPTTVAPAQPTNTLAPPMPTVTPSLLVSTPAQPPPPTSSPLPWIGLGVVVIGLVAAGTIAAIRRQRAE